MYGLPGAMFWGEKGFRDRIWGRKHDFRSNLGSETRFQVKFGVREGFLGGVILATDSQGFGVKKGSVLGSKSQEFSVRDQISRKNRFRGVKFTGFIDFGRKMSENAPRKVGKYPPFFGVPDALKDPREKGGKNHLKLG